MKVTCVCPTYRRPKLLENSIACFMAQTYQDRELLILDDAGELPEACGPGWKIVSTKDRFPSIGAKYNAICEMATGDVIAVWEDDDIYLPRHLSNAMRAIRQGAEFVKNPWMWSLYTGQLEMESAAGRGHAALVFTKDLWGRVKWPETDQPEFDQSFIAGLTAESRATDASGLPTYCYRHGSTQHYHGQHTMQKGPEWYRLIPTMTTPQPRSAITPAMDAETLRTIRRMHCGVSL